MPAVLLSFPSQAVSDLEKMSPEYGLKVARAIEQEWFKDTYDGRYRSTQQSFHNLRLYARGEQSIQKYKDELSINGDFRFKRDSGGRGVMGIDVTDPDHSLEALNSAGKFISLDDGTSNRSMQITSSTSGRYRIVVEGQTEFSIIQGDNGSGSAETQFRIMGDVTAGGSVPSANRGNVAIGPSALPASKLTVKGGDIEVEDSGDGLILSSPNGTRYRITVDNSGNLSTSAV